MSGQDRFSSSSTGLLLRCGKRSFKDSQRRLVHDERVAVGEHKKPFTLRIDPDTKQQLVNLQDAFWPFCDDLSSAIRIAIRTSHALIFTPLKLREVFSRLQRIQGVTLQDAAHQLEFDFPVCATGKKPPCRVVPSEDPNATVRRLAYSAISLRRNYRRVGRAEEMVKAYGTSFRSKSITYMRLCA